LTEVAYLKTSLIDFPGRIASLLFLPGCNFRCPYCHNAALVERSRAGVADGLAPLHEFLEYLDRRRGLISGVVISGGEPLLSPEAPRIAAAIHERGLAVKLDTNGSFPSRIAAVHADYIALDFKAPPRAYPSLAPGLPGAGTAVLESLALVRASGTPYELRITCAPGLVGAAELEEMAVYLEAGDEVILQDFRPGGCLDPEWDAVEPYSRAQMEAMLKVLARRAPRARMRGP